MQGKLYDNPNERQVRHVRRIEDLDLFGDGNLYTICILTEKIRPGGGSLEVAGDAAIIDHFAQNPARYVEVTVPETVLERARANVRRWGSGRK